MPRSIEDAANGFVSSTFFKDGVKSGNYSEIEKQVVSLVKEYHKQLCIKATKVYGQNRWSTDQIIKPALRNMDFVKVEYYPR